MRLIAVTPSEIATAMGLDLQEAWLFARTIEQHYEPTRLQTTGKKGKTRIIDALKHRGVGKRRLKKLLKWFSTLHIEHPRAHGGVKGRSCFTNAAKHLGKQFVWTRDAEDCYPSITADVFKRELRKLGCRSDTASLLTMLCTVRNRIPQGSPLSPFALNLFFWMADQAVASKVGQNGLSYGRNADDFVLSGDSFEDGEIGIEIVESELAKRQIRINQKKKSKSGLQPGSQMQTVHNIVVNSRRGTAICAEHCRTGTELARSYLESCRSISAQSIESVARKRAKLDGWMSHHRQAMFSRAVYIRRQLEAGDRIVLRRLRAIGLHAYKNRWWASVQTKANGLLIEPRRLALVWTRRTNGESRQTNILTSP